MQEHRKDTRPAAAANTASLNSQARQRRFLAGGLCRSCGKRPFISGQTRCSRCAKAVALGSKRLRIARYASGRCGECGRRSRKNRRQCLACAGRSYAARRRHIGKLRGRVMAHYGGSVCVCCGETEMAFLCMDHVNGGGSRHRRADHIARASIYQWLVNRGFPEGFRVLCANCNQAIRFGRACPHQKSLDTSIRPGVVSPGR